jgi:hypothetical protein
MKTNQFILYAAEVAVCSHNTKQINAVWTERKNVKFLTCWCIT